MIHVLNRAFGCGPGFMPGDAGARLVRALDPGAVKPRPCK